MDEGGSEIFFPWVQVDVNFVVWWMDKTSVQDESEWMWINLSLFWPVQVSVSEYDFCLAGWCG